ncbi:MAG: hypothetical protein KIH01_05825 [Candidatus Freyarchaeota archaeon]|nr:hypothetical protein [Candidatus Jordarchaeia archaeon]
MRVKRAAALALVLAMFMSILLVYFAPKTNWLPIPYRDIETKNLTFTVNSTSYFDVNFYLYSGYNVEFSFNYSGFIVNVTLMDSENYEKYQRGENYTSILNILATSTGKTYTGNYTAVKADRYHLVFESYFTNATVSLTTSLEVLKFLPVPYRA